MKSLVLWQWVKKD